MNLMFSMVGLGTKLLISKNQNYSGWFVLEKTVLKIPEKRNHKIGESSLAISKNF